MKKYTIELTDEEEDLYKIIAKSEGCGIGTPSEIWQEMCDAGYELALSLFRRKAFSPLRVDFLTNRDLNIGTKYSVIEEFSNNGTVGEDIFRHPHFIPHLLYLIRGPKLPKSLLDSFEECVRTEPSFESEDVRTAIDLLRKEVRIHKLNPKIASEEIFKLAYESGLDVSFARILRDNIRQMRFK